MKNSLLLSSLLAAMPALSVPVEESNVAAIPTLERRQFDLGAVLGGLLGQLGGGKTGSGKAGGGAPSELITAMNAVPAKTEKLAPAMRKDAVREKMWYGPYTLPPVTTQKMPTGFLKMDPSGTQVNARISGFCNNCTVLYGKATLFFENGTKATAERGVYEHHIVTVDVAKPRRVPFYLCDGQNGFLGSFPGAGFIVSGNDEAANFFTTPDGKFNSGYLRGAANALVMQAELVNYRTESQKVYVVMEYEYIKGQADGPADSTFSLFSVTGCKAPDYHAKERVYNMTSATIPVPIDGYIINSKGHLHDGGDHILLRLNGKVICDSKAVYTKDTRGPGASTGMGGMGGHSHGRRAADPPAAGSAQDNWEVIAEMTQCTEPVRVRKGDKLDMVSFYDGVKHPPRPTQDHEGKHVEADEMGVFFISFAVSDKPAEQLQVKGNLLVRSNGQKF